MLQQRRRQRRSIGTDHGDSFSSSCSHTHPRQGADGRDAEGLRRCGNCGGSTEARTNKRSLIAPGQCRRHLQSRPRLRHTACSSPKRLPPRPSPICAPAQAAKQRVVARVLSGHDPKCPAFQTRECNACAQWITGSRLSGGEAPARHSLSEPAPQPLLRCISVRHLSRHVLPPRTNRFPGVSPSQRCESRESSKYPVPSFPNPPSLRTSRHSLPKSPSLRTSHSTLTP